jgi:type IV pilus assembly protein PilA
MIKREKGFTLIELLVVIGIIGILAAIVLVAVNPGRQFALARDQQRRSDLYSITNAVYQFAAEHDGNLPDTDGDDTASNFPTSATCVGTDTVTDGCFNLGVATDETGTEIVTPTYIAAIPFDPSTGTPENTGYTIYVDGTGRVVAAATGELTDPITVTR